MNPPGIVNEWNSVACWWVQVQMQILPREWEKIFPKHINEQLWLANEKEDEETIMKIAAIIQK